MGLLSELSLMGFDENIESIVFSESEKEILIDSRERKRSPSDTKYLYVKSIECPCCGIDFDTFIVRAGKITPAGQDDDLRPRFNEMDPLKYDAVMCPICGYSSLFKNFETATALFKDKIRQHVTPHFTGMIQEGFNYSYDEAILHYKMALLCDTVGSDKISRRAYTCLKLSWVIRGYLESESDKLNLRRRKELEADEFDCTQLAYYGLAKAYSEEKLPICGMDETTICYLLSVLSYKMRDYKETIRYIYIVLGNRTAPQKVKDKLLGLRDKAKVYVKEEI